MNDIRLKCFQEGAHMLGVELLVRDRSIQPVELVLVRVDKILVWITLVSRGEERPRMNPSQGFEWRSTLG